MRKLLKNNRSWAKSKGPDFFNSLVSQQNPQYFWIGCADSRVPANVILGLDPGEVFVQRNVGNQACHTDLNCMSCLEYAVKELKVRCILVCGHYGCGAVKAALKMPSKTHSFVNHWISDIRECRNQNREEMLSLPSQEAQYDRLCELNVMRQTFNVCTSPVVQDAWDKGQDLVVYGVVYSLKNGFVQKLVGPIRNDADVPAESSMLTNDDSDFGMFTSSFCKGTPMTSSDQVDFSEKYTMDVVKKVFEHNDW
eukprot:CAMPEP_0175056484 /NCGR_PEP_ID=MMETSP0052_2-20121109/10701_1 /TAXON_ID=51329 ORGANISM="Polytomella parva, Strain SAG 63-3" /NCGR_SAMPLE_ID=MMETSP0052_2 /ASSEMBLY_ACC=CAM_ASM_000194 /LENGTH=251 /DNA_ID=CAMNT_0016321525 /DNA_START=83 /DNA_END=835 /DNA_ORIENTATION=+